MKGKSVVNAKIKNWWIKKDRSISGDPVQLFLEVASTDGAAVITYDMNKIDKLFQVLEIDNIDDLKGSPCIVFCEDNYIRTIGNFLYKYYDFLHDSGSTKYEEENWIDYWIWKKSIEEYYKEKENDD